jgi:hypothetical protein
MEQLHAVQPRVCTVPVCLHIIGLLQRYMEGTAMAITMQAHISIYAKNAFDTGR